MGLIQAPERHGHLILRGPSPHFKLSELYSWKLRLCPSSFLPLQTMLRWICLFTSLMQLFKRIFSEITPRGSWVRGFRMTDMPDSPACAPEWLQLCKLSVVEDSQISYISQQLTSRSFLVFINLMALKEWLNVTLCWISLNTNDFGLPSLWISSSTELPTHLHSPFFIVDFFGVILIHLLFSVWFPYWCSIALISQYIISLSLTLYTVSLVEQKFSFFI